MNQIRITPLATALLVLAIAFIPGAFGQEGKNSVSDLIKLSWSERVKKLCADRFPADSSDPALSGQADGRRV